jgi:hypothetical protein
MAGDPCASAGTKVFICATPSPAADTKAEFEALTWVEIDLVESVSEVGDTSAQITWTGLSSNRVRKLKGANDAGDVSVLAAMKATDPGQIAAIAAQKTKFSYPIKILYEDSEDANDTDSVDYFHAKVMSARKTIGGNSDVLKRTFVLAIDTEPLEVPMAVVA